ncbi:MAG: HAD-IG family 5'-nucleotidase [Myxococcota bacterium]|nr:HAD-IG family 5'-nucleotidase [Myxococcota bacterium]
MADTELATLIAAPHEKRETGRSREVFVNRNMRMSNVELIGFDMDYTLAIYHMRRIEQLSFDMTLERLVSQLGYPAQISQIQYDHSFVMRGLMVDKVNGNLIKMDRFGHVGRAYHGLRPLDRETWKRLYRHERVKAKNNPQYAWIDTLFALPEACLFAGIIELLEGQGQSVAYGKLYDDIRETIDSVHRDNSLKAEIRKDIGRYIFKDPELGPALHKLRSAGKKLFVLTNSAWDYTQAVMSYLLDGVVPEYPSWRNYFDWVITSAAKPAFFSDGRPFLEIDHSTEAGPVVGETQTLDRSKVYQGGNLSDFQRLTGYSADRVLYVGDHIFGDILKSKKTSLWRTCMIVQEIEDEISYCDGRQEEIARLSEIEVLRARLDDEVGQRKTRLNAAERKLERAGPGLPEEERAALEESRKAIKAELDKLRRSLKEAEELADTLEGDIEQGFNRYWGLMFKEGNENSRFGEQVEQFACVYTSRVSNFLHYSPMQYFRSPRDLMPHEHAGALSGKLSPLGSEGPARAASNNSAKE